MHGRAPHGRVSLGLVRSRALRCVGRAGAQAAPVHGGPLPAEGEAALLVEELLLQGRLGRLGGRLRELSRPARRRGVAGRRLSRRGDGDGRGLGWPDGSAMYHSIYSVLLFLCSRAMMGWDALRYTRLGGWDAGCGTLSLGDSDRRDWGPSRHSLGWSGMRYATPTGVVWDAGCATLTLDDSDRGRRVRNAGVWDGLRRPTYLSDGGPRFGRPGGPSVPGSGRGRRVRNAGVWDGLRRPTYLSVGGRAPAGPGSIRARARGGCTRTERDALRYTHWGGWDAGHATLTFTFPSRLVAAPHIGLGAEVAG